MVLRVVEVVVLHTSGLDYKLDTGCWLEGLEAEQGILEHHVRVPNCLASPSVNS